MQICTNEKTYICECGKIFYNPQSYNGHKSHCKSHLLAKGGMPSLEASLERQRRASTAAQVAHKEAYQNRQQQALEQWIVEKHTCEKCGQLMLKKFGTGRFCSRTCANSRAHSDKTKQKIKASLDATLITKNKPVSRNRKACIVCGTAIKSVNKTGVCRYCLENTPEGLHIKQELGRKGYETKQVRGTHKGWQSRNITSYAEQFWTRVLDNNNIAYQREVPVKHDKSNYFLDFVIETSGKLIDLEIDGKQHTYSDRKASDSIRDQYLTDNGYLIYRIPWNEISTEQGKAEMQSKINAFLEFYNSL